MDAPHGPAAFAVNRMDRSIREYSLYQAIPLIMERLRQRHPELDEARLEELVQLHANPGLGFAASDIDDLQFFEEAGLTRARLQINALGLFGAVSPLPASYSEQALGDDLAACTTREFLDVFHHRLLRLLVPIWRKYRYHARFRSGATDPFSKQLFSLIGLGGKHLRETTEINWKRLLPYLGLLSLRAHSAALIEAVLRYYFKHAPLFIEQCTERAVTISPPQRNRLGRANSRLGEDAVLGERVRDRSGRFRIHIRELKWDSFHAFLPIGAGHKPLSALVRFTQRDPLDYDIQLELLPGEIRELRIGADNTCHLGWTSWLGRERADGVVTLSSPFIKDGNR
jgi:type VI secretion system protein ImpH